MENDRSTHDENWENDEAADSYGISTQFVYNQNYSK